MLLNESLIISAKTMELIKREFNGIFDKKEYSLFSWGSLARREMGPYSDLDIILLSQKHLDNNAFIRFFEERLLALLPNNYIDLLNAYSLDELLRISKIDGTDMQAVLFMQQEAGRKIIIHNNGNLVREILHIFCNLNYVYGGLFGSENIKFGPYNIKYYNFAILLAKYYGCKENDTISAFKFLALINKISNEQATKYIENFQKILYYRNIVQRANETYDCKFDRQKIIDFSSEDFCIDMEKKLVQINEQSQMMYYNLLGIMLDILVSNFTKDEIVILKKCIQHVELSVSEINLLLRENKEEMMILLAYYIKNPAILEQIRSQNEDKWYVLYGIANNPNVYANTLYKLMDYRLAKDEGLQELYTDFAWRNIYLYVAKNPRANIKIKNYILNYENARPMDIAAAQKIKRLD